jgi:hypothetical protein
MASGGRRLPRMRLTLHFRLSTCCPISCGVLAPGPRPSRRGSHPLRRGIHSLSAWRQSPVWAC